MNIDTALIRGQLKDYRGAIKSMNVYLQLSPDAPNARAALLKAREARKKNEETRAWLETAGTRSAAAYAAIKNRLASNRGNRSNSRTQGLVAQYSGRVEIFKKNGERSYLDGNGPGFLELGDEMTTSGSSSAEVQTLDGRATVQLGESSKLKLEEDTPQGQVLRLVQGKIYSAVEKMDDFANMLQEKTKQYSPWRERTSAPPRSSPGGREHGPPSWPSPCGRWHRARNTGP